MLSAFVLPSPDKRQKRVIFGVTLVFITREHKAKKKKPQKTFPEVCEAEGCSEGLSGADRSEEWALTSEDGVARR